ncbi:MAG: carbamoyltransferase HypF [Bacteroidota bacterium]
MTFPKTENENRTYIITVKGLVQGVGFRPFVYKAVAGLGLTGSVENRNNGVFIKVNGSEETIKILIEKLKLSAPSASAIESIEIAEQVYEDFETFSIVKSENVSEEVTEISPDIAVCDECLYDLKNQKHRIDYPFINCTNCGPRFTIIEDLPYDREKTTMSKFIMCETCKDEYINVLDRRFHAQPVACNNCGPVYELHVNENIISDFAEILNTAATFIDDGLVLAMKGLGGFHLACDALNDTAVKRLRKFKNRESKPLAVMFRNLLSIKEYAEISVEGEIAITSWRRPIVLLKEKSEKKIPESVSNALGTIGAMLPYMPFHYLLFKKLKTDAIVLTSGNISEEPIIIDNIEAKEKLSPISDALLIYNRGIYNRTDDSVIFIANEKERIIRRSRGYVPNPVRLGFNAEGIFAAGAELKNCFCFGKGNQAILSQHIGDLKNLESYEFYKETVNQFKKLFRVKPILAVGDMHPDYLSTRYVNEMDVPKMFVQHHHAHVASCMAEHGLNEKVIGVSFDGTGYGDDGNIWGGEFFICDFKEYERISHFEYVPIPGGDRVSEEPWRMAVSYLYKVYGKNFQTLNLPFLKNISEKKNSLLIQAIDKKLNCPLTSSAGRLFDAVAAITGICVNNGFEAEAPMRLESIIDEKIPEKYPYEIGDTICFDQTINNIVDDVLNNVEQPVISAKFHNTIIDVVISVVCHVGTKSGIDKAVLSGGVFQNRYLLAKTEEGLKEKNFNVYTHIKVPSNDGGLSLGQLAIAVAKIKTQSTK